MVVGEDGCLYLSYFTGSASDFYRLTFNEETNVYEATIIGSAGKDVWPVTLYAAEPNASTAGTNSLPQPWMHADSSTVSAEDLATLEANVHIGHLYQDNDAQKQLTISWKRSCWLPEFRLHLHRSSLRPGGLHR